MPEFERMRALRAFENQHLLFLKTRGHHHLIVEIGHQQAVGKPLTLKQLFLLNIGSVATIQRHLRKLKELGLVQHQRAADDRRAVELTLTPKCLRIFAKYDTLMDSQPPPRDGARVREAPGHVCGLCNCDAGGRRLIVSFLAQGLKRGDKCVLVAPAEAQNAILAGLPDRRKAPRHLIVSEGYDATDAQCAFLKRLRHEAKQAGQALCIASDMSWTLSRNLQIDALLAIEKRLDALAKPLSVTALCVYDARRFSSGDFLQAVKCHRAHARHPIALG